MINGVDVSGCINLNKRDKVSCFDILYDKCKEVPNCYYKQLARKTQECEKLEDFRTLTREVFTFGDSDVDDENFIKYLQEYSRSYEEAIDGYYRLTDITGIDYTVHGGADIEEIIKRVDILKQECEQLKEKLFFLENNEDLLISNLQILWGKQIAEEQGDCKNIDYSKPRTKEIYHKITEIDRTLKDVAFAQSVNIGKTKPLGNTGSPKSYKRWEARERKLLEREFLK